MVQDYVDMPQKWHKVEALSHNKGLGFSVYRELNVINCSK